MMMDLLHGVAHLWFLLMLTMVFALALLTRRFWKNLSCAHAFILLIALIVFNDVADYFSWKDYIHFLALHRVVQFIPAFYFGYMVSEYDLIKKVNTGVNVMIILLILYVFLFVVAGMGIPVASRLCGYAKPFASLSFIMYLHANMRKMDIKSNILDSLDKCSMGIYILHHIFLYDLLIRMDYVAEMMNQHPLLCPVVLFIIVLPISWWMSARILKSRIKFVFG